MNLCVYVCVIGRLTVSDRAMCRVADHESDHLYDQLPDHLKITDREYTGFF